MATTKLEREGVRQEEAGDPLVEALGKERDQCCEEMGIPPSDIIELASGCDRCPVERKCKQLWGIVVNSITHNLSLAEYRRLSQKFYMLKQERNRILEKRSGKCLQKS
jgi:hypothetical protein